MAHSNTSPCRYLVIQLARFGDLVQTKRLILSLAARPGAEVHLAVDRSLAALARLIYPELTIHALCSHAMDAGATKALQENLPVFEELRACGFSQVYNLNFSGLSFALSTLFDPATVRGYRLEEGSQRRDLWASMAMRWTRHRCFAGLNLVDYWAEFADDPVPAGAVNPVARRGGKGIGVVLAGRNSRRSLPPATLALLAGAVVQGTGAQRVVLVGSEAERPLARKLVDIMPTKLRNMAEDTVGRTDWAGLIETLTGLDAVLTPDTGTMHLAAHLGVPVHAFFLSSAWCFETGPYGLGHRVWQTDISCAPCLETEPCPIQTQCAESFAGRNLLRHLAGNNAFEPPEGLTGYVSAFDSVGCTYRPVLGKDAEAGQRQQFRALMAGVLGYGIIGDASTELAREFLHDADWMLPRRLLTRPELEFTLPPAAAS